MNGAYDPETYDLVNAASFHGDIEWYRGKAGAADAKGVACRESPHA
jgi:hypothetical protein